MLEDERRQNIPVAQLGHRRVSAHLTPVYGWHSVDMGKPGFAASVSAAGAIRERVGSENLGTSIGIGASIVLDRNSSTVHVHLTVM